MWAVSPLNPRLLKEQQRNYIMQRSNLLKKMGLSTHVTAQVLASVGTSDLREEDRNSIIRGLNSLDSAVIQEARKKLKSALKNGYHSLLDRYELDLQYRVRMLEVGRREADMLRMELSANLVLAAPKQSQAQRTLGVGLGSTSDANREARVHQDRFGVPAQRAARGFVLSLDRDVPRDALQPQSVRQRGDGAE